MRLCLAVRSNLPALADSLGQSDLSVVKQHDGSCSVNARDLSVSFSFDDRDGQVTSSLSFGDRVPDETRLYVHILGGLFDLPNSEDDLSENLDEKVRIECDRVNSVLKGMELRKLSPRDLYFFQYGYNAAYTDYASGKWST